MSVPLDIGNGPQRTDAQRQPRTDSALTMADGEGTLPEAPSEPLALPNLEELS